MDPSLLPESDREARDPAAPFIGAARTFPAAASGDDEREEEGGGAGSGAARVSPPGRLEGATRGSGAKAERVNITN